MKIEEVIEAALADHRAELESWLQSGGDVNARDARGQTALWCAVRNHHIELIEWLVEQGAHGDAHDGNLSPNIEGVYNRWRSPSSLLHSVATGHFRGPHPEALMRTLITLGVASLEALDDQGYTPLAVACHHNALEAVEVLLELGANPQGAGPPAKPPLLLASSEEVLLALLDAGAEPDPPADFAETPLGLALERRELEVVRRLLALGADPMRPHRHRLPLLLAARDIRAVHVPMLVAAGVDLDATDRDGSALELASYLGRLEFVEALLEAGAGRLDEALYAACRSEEEGAPAIVRRLLEAGADACATPSQTSALHQAARYGMAESCRALIEAGAEVDVRGPRGRTPLWLAAEKGRAEAARALLEAGAAVTAADDDGVEPYAAARQHTHLPVLTVLREFGAVHTRPGEPTPCTEPRLGGRARHKLFGEGEIVGFSGAGDALKLRVVFSEAGEKTLLARFLELL